MNHLQNLKLVSSPNSSSPLETFATSQVSKRGIEPTKLFQDSFARNDNRKSFGDISLAKSGFLSASTLQESTVRGIGRGIGNLSEDRIRKIAKDFVSMYGSGSEIVSTGLYRMQR